MRNELEAEFCKEFPSIFRDYHGDMRVTCMAWGMSCGDGWEVLIQNICLYINNAVENCKSAIISEYKKKNNIDYASELSPEILKELKVDEVAAVADQVKEKYGTLSFYWHGENLTEEWYNRIDSAIDMAAMLSGHICEECGERGQLRGPGWLFTACERHARGRQTLKEYSDSEQEKLKGLDSKNV